jgi:hypothetical protein
MAKKTKRLPRRTRKLRSLDAHKPGSRSASKPTRRKRARKRKPKGIPVGRAVVYIPGLNDIQAARAVDLVVEDMAIGAVAVPYANHIVREQIRGRRERRRFEA